MKHLVFMLFFLLPAAGFAQQRPAADSLFIYRQDMALLQIYTQSAAQLVSAPVQQVSKAFVNYQTANGHFRTAQEAEKSQVATFGTIGIATLGRFKLAGHFNFERTWQDSLAWTLQGIQDPVAPYYFAAGKAGHYERLNYRLGGLLAYRLANRWHLATGIDYFYNTTARNVDPRPSVQTFHLLLKPELVYQHGTSTFSLGGLWGYSHEQNSVGYKNNTFATSTLYPDRINYFMMGYGYYSPVRRQTLRRLTDVTGININYALTQHDRYLRAGLNFVNSDEENNTPLERSESDLLIGRFKLQRYQFNLLAGKATARGRQQLALTAGYQNGRDRNAELGGSNFRYQAYYATLGYTRTNSTRNWEWGAFANLNNAYRRDISAAHELDITYAEPGLMATWYKKRSNTDRLYFSLSPSLRLPLSSALRVPTPQVNVFTVNIAYPYYSYLRSTAAKLNAVAEYVTPRLFKGLSSSIKIDTHYIKGLNVDRTYPQAAFQPSGDFLTVNIGFNLYF